MSATFSRTLRSLRAERSRVTVTLLVLVLLVLGGWVAWLALGEVALYEVTDTARLEVRGAVHPVAALRGGRLVRADAHVGEAVEAGQVLFELDSEAEHLAIDEGTARLTDLEGRAAALDEQIQAEQEALEADREASDSAVDEARAWTRESETRSDRAQQRVDTLGNLVDRGLATGDDLHAAQAELASADAEVRARRLQARRLEREGSVRFEDREARIAELGRQRAELDGEAGVVRASVGRLGNDLEATIVRAPVAGRIGEVADVRVGAVVAPGDVLARVIPEGELQVVAQFDATSAGRLEPGQTARLRFPGYPWTQFGTVEARVETVAQESVEGSLRVELSLHDYADSPIPMAHSLPVFVEVEVERVSPLELLLRAAGKWVEGA